jgi:hypothetical protein
MEEKACVFPPSQYLPHKNILILIRVCPCHPRNWHLKTGLLQWSSLGAPKSLLRNCKWYKKGPGFFSLFPPWVLFPSPETDNYLVLVQLVHTAGERRTAFLWDCCRYYQSIRNRFWFWPFLYFTLLYHPCTDLNTKTEYLILFHLNIIPDTQLQRRGPTIWVADQDRDGLFRYQLCWSRTENAIKMLCKLCIYFSHWALL